MLELEEKNTDRRSFFTNFLFFFFTVRSPNDSEIF